MPVEAPLRAGERWTRQDSGKIDLHHIRGLGIALDSCGSDPFTIWIDGLTVD